MKRIFATLLIFVLCIALCCTAAAETDISELDCLIDLHLHLDGSISTASARALAELQGIDIPEDDDELRALLQVDEGCTSLNEFLTKFDFPCRLLQTKEGLTASVVNLLDELKADGVMYAEIRFAPQTSGCPGLF